MPKYSTLSKGSSSRLELHIQGLRGRRHRWLPVVFDVRSAPGSSHRCRSAPYKTRRATRSPAIVAQSPSSDMSLPLEAIHSDSLRPSNLCPVATDEARFLDSDEKPTLQRTLSTAFYDYALEPHLMSRVIVDAKAIENPCLPVRSATSGKSRRLFISISL